MVSSIPDILQFDPKDILKEKIGQVIGLVNFGKFGPSANPPSEVNIRIKLILTAAWCPSDVIWLLKAAIKWPSNEF